MVIPQVPQEVRQPREKELEKWQRTELSTYKHEKKHTLNYVSFS